MADLLSGCYCCNRYGGIETEGFITFYAENEEDMRTIAETLAGCNRIVADQFDYTPDEDLTDPYVLGIRTYVLPASMRWKKLDYPRLDGYKYILNGLDDEEEIYDMIVRML